MSEILPQELASMPASKPKSYVWCWIVSAIVLLFAAIIILIWLILAVQTQNAGLANPFSSTSVGSQWSQGSNQGSHQWSQGSHGKWWDAWPHHKHHHEQTSSSASSSSSSSEPMPYHHKHHQNEDDFDYKDLFNEAAKETLAPLDNNYPTTNDADAEYNIPSQAFVFDNFGKWGLTDPRSTEPRPASYRRCLVRYQRYTITERNNQMPVSVSLGNGKYWRKVMYIDPGEYRVDDLTSKMQQLFNSTFGFGWQVFTGECGNEIIIANPNTVWTIQEGPASLFDYLGFNSNSYGYYQHAFNSKQTIRRSIYPGFP